jgi:hypothetical protein
MTPEQLRQVLRELDGERDLEIAFIDYYAPIAPGSQGHLGLRNAMLIPDEPDHMVKVTDGKSIYILDSDKVAWIRIALKKPIS